MQEALTALLPSFNLPAMTGSGTGGIVRAAGLRGLNADQVLILVNNKRRHNSALLQTSWSSGGSTPVDIDLIPTAAISRMEVLRDGITRNISLSKGLPLPGGGSLFLAGEQREQERFTRGVPSPRTRFGSNFTVLTDRVEVINLG